MEEREFYAHILAGVIIEAGAAIIVGGDDTADIIKAMAAERCCEALREIRDILDDDRLEDKECFGRIERIVCLYEKLGPGAGSRHDF